jgi:hypothetical protein
MIGNEPFFDGIETTARAAPTHRASAPHLVSGSPMLPKMLIRAGSHQIIAAFNWPYDGWRKNVDKDGAVLPPRFGLHDPCARERRRGWTSIVPQFDYRMAQAASPPPTAFMPASATKHIEKK